MSYGNFRITKRGKKSTTKVGIRSIYDIINKNATEDWKINYIRHHYVYYEGNYDLFHDKNGNPTDVKELLDDIIKNVVRGIADPSELSEINKQIAALAKEKKLEEKVRKEKELEVYIQQQKEEVQASTQPIINIPESPNYKKGITNAEAYFKIIDEYLNNLPEKEKEKASTWKYGDLKKVAIWWMKNNRPTLLSAEKMEEIRSQEQATSELLAGYKKYAAKKWKN